MLQALERLSRREKLMILAGVVLLVSIGLSMFVHQPLKRKTRTLQSQLDEVHTQLQPLQVLARKKAEMETRIAGAEKRLTELVPLVPREKQLPEFILFLFLQERRIQLKINAIEVGAGSTVESFTAFPVSISVTGTYPQLVDLIESIEGLPRFLKIEGLSVSNAAVAASLGAAPATAPVSDSVKVQGYFVVRLYVDDQVEGAEAPDKAAFPGTLGRPDPFQPAQ